MAETRTDPHAAILTWLDENGHAGWCDAKVHRLCCDGECNCPQGKLAGLARRFVEQHVAQGEGPEAFCPIELTTYPCRTIRVVADALGVAK